MPALSRLLLATSQPIIDSNRDIELVQFHELKGERKKIIQNVATAESYQASHCTYIPISVSWISFSFLQANFTYHMEFRQLQKSERRFMLA
jgi:hypothetical protein